MGFEIPSYSPKREQIVFQQKEKLEAEYKTNLADHRQDIKMGRISGEKLAKVVESAEKLGQFSRDILAVTHAMSVDDRGRPVLIKEPDHSDLDKYSEYIEKMLDEDAPAINRDINLYKTAMAQLIQDKEKSSRSVSEGHKATKINKPQNK